MLLQKRFPRSLLASTRVLRPVLNRNIRCFSGVPLTAADSAGTTSTPHSSSGVDGSFMKKNPELPIYFDYQATTPLDPRVLDKMLPYLQENFGNPHSRSHAHGWEAEEAVERVT